MIAQVAADAVRTVGVNWGSVLAVAASVVTVGAAVAAILTKPWRDKLAELSDQVDEIKSDAKTAVAAAQVTSQSVARIEGFLAGSNGMGKSLPPVAGQR